MKNVEERAIPMIEPPLADKERDGHECFHVLDLQTRFHQVSSSTHILNMVATNYALVEKHGIILHVRLCNWNTSQTLLITKKSHASWTSIGGWGQHYPFY